MTYSIEYKLMNVYYILCISPETAIRKITVDITSECQT